LNYDSHHLSDLMIYKTLSMKSEFQKFTILICESIHINIQYISITWRICEFHCPWIIMKVMCSFEYLNHRFHSFKYLIVSKFFSFIYTDWNCVFIDSTSCTFAYVKALCSEFNSMYSNILRKIWIDGGYYFVVVDELFIS